MVDGILYLLGIALHTVHSLGNIASQHLTTIKRNKTTLLILYVKVGFACYLTIEFLWHRNHTQNQFPREGSAPKIEILSQGPISRFPISSPKD